MREKQKHASDGDKAVLHRKTKHIIVKKKARSPEEEEEPMMSSEGEFGMEEAEMDETGTAENVGICEEEAEKCKKKKHIHPCICDLTDKQKMRIEKFLHDKQTMQLKYERRVREIEEELARAEEERLEREREIQEQEELFGDEYEMLGKKKKRKKRSARRASMVSLGVKQIINWRKEPRIKLKPNVTSTLRKKYTSYCGKLTIPLSPIVSIDYHKEPDIAIRTTVTSDKRSMVNIAKKNYLIENEDKRPLFRISYYT
ncbi:hypothetical protein PGB90_003610 [Kerria lacca]